MTTARNVQSTPDTNEVSIQFPVHGEALANYLAEGEESGQADVAEQDESLANDIAAFARKEPSKHEGVRTIELVNSLPKTATPRLHPPHPVVSRRLGEGVR
jgi:hypothetical protein